MQNSRIFFGVLSLYAIEAIASDKPNISSGKPNIIYIYADDLGYGELGCYGQQKIKTPNLDQLAKDGIRFTEHYAGAPVCAPSRCMLMTGKHSGHSYIRDNYEMGSKNNPEGGQMPIPEGIYTIPQMLKKAGYINGMIGKWGLGVNNTSGAPLKQGFDYFYGFLDQVHAQNHYPRYLWENEQKIILDNPAMHLNVVLDSNTVTNEDWGRFKGKEYAEDLMTTKALKFIEKYKTQPFFLYLPYTIPHAPLQVPDEYINKYVGKFTEPPYYGKRRYAPAKYPYSTYAGMITFLDEQVGIILEQIKKLGLDKKTIIMFSSDNGTTFNGGVNAEFFNSVDHLRGLKMDLFEGGIRVPFIAKWPGKIKPGTTSELVSAQYDLMATLADITGQDPGNTDGISFLPTLLGNDANQEKHEFLYFEYGDNGGQMAIRLGDWKGVKLNLVKNPDSPWMLFNLKTDREEKINVSSEHPELIKKISAIAQKEHQMAQINEWNFIKAASN